MTEQGPRTVKGVVDRHRNIIGDQIADELIRDLIHREDMIADMLRTAGTQLGAFPEFVAKVLADAGLGEPVTPEHHEYLNRQFALRLAWLQEQFRNQ
jgi:hypothetical protein